MLLIGRYYNQTIGRVTHRFLKNMLLAVAFLMILASQWFEGFWQLPISASILIFAFLYAFSYRATGRILHQCLAKAFHLAIMTPLSSFQCADFLFLQ